MPKMSRSISVMAFALLILGAVGCGEQEPHVQSEAAAREALSRAEFAWLAAYDNHDVVAMDSLVADGFRITFSGGRIETKADVIAKLKPGETAPPADSVPVQFTEGRTIRILGNTAILSGIYVYPRPDGTFSRSRYTDTWMYLDGRWQVVASHLSKDEKLESRSGSDTP